MTAKLKLVTDNTTAVKKKPIRKRSPNKFYDISDRLPSPGRHVLVEYHFDYSESPSYHFKLAYISGAYRAGAFHPSDRGIIDGKPFTFRILRWRYLPTDVTNYYSKEDKKMIRYT